MAAADPAPDPSATTVHHPATGTQVHLRNGAQEAVVGSVGATLVAYAVDGTALVAGPPSDDLDDGLYRGKLLAPWPNRVGDGRYRWRGREHQLPLTEVERRTALHGLVTWADFAVAEVAADRAVLRHVLRPRYGYPFALELLVTWQLDAAGLSCRTEARNLGDEVAPWGLGAHPYLRVADRVDDVVLTLPAACTLAVDPDRLLPTGGVRPVDGDDDFRTPRPIGAQALDTCFGDLVRDADGRVRTVLAGPDGHRVQLWQDEAFGWVQVYTADDAPDDGRRASVAVEPMTCPPDALRSGVDVIALAPGTTHVATWGLAVTGDG